MLYYDMTALELKEQDKLGILKNGNMLYCSLNGVACNEERGDLRYSVYRFVSMSCMIHSLICSFLPQSNDLLLYDNNPLLVKASREGSVLYKLDQLLFINQDSG